MWRQRTKGSNRPPRQAGQCAVQVVGVCTQQQHLCWQHQRSVSQPTTHVTARMSCTHNMHHQRSDARSAATAAMSGTRMIANVQPPIQSARFTVHQPLPCQLQQQQCSTLYGMHTTTAQVHNMNACSGVHITTSVVQVGGTLYTGGLHRAMHVSGL